MTDARAPDNAAAAPVSLSRAQQRLAEAALPRVRPMALSLSALYGGVNVEDLVGAGHEALTRAALRYKPETGVPFPSYAHYRIRGAMVDSLRKGNRAVRQRSRATKALAASQAILAEAAQEGASQSATASLAERVAAAKALVAKTTAVVMLTHAHDTDVDEVPALDAANAEQSMLNAETVTMLREMVSDLPEPARELVHAIYVEGITMRAFAKRVERSESAVSRRHTRILGELAKRMRKRGAAP